MARGLYSLLLHFLIPFLLVRLGWRGRSESGYRHAWRERFGAENPRLMEECPRSARPLIWLHAVSLGETRAMEPLLERLLAEYPDHAFLLTHMTATGREAGEHLAQRCRTRGREVHVRWLPYDLPWAQSRFLSRWQPVLTLIMETEVWPNLLHCLETQRRQVVLVNARLSERSARGYQRLARLTRPAFLAFTRVLAQTPADGERLSGCGVSAMALGVVGNLKFDRKINEELLGRGLAWRHPLMDLKRPVFLAASTREGEEALILTAWKAARADVATMAGFSDRQFPLLLIVPRHPQRFSEVAESVKQMGMTLARRSYRNHPGQSGFEGEGVALADVWLGDSMGEMEAYYALADVAFIGGSLLPYGGQNLIEAAMIGRPLLLGEHTFNFAAAADEAVACGAARRVDSASSLVAGVLAVLKDAEVLRTMSRKAVAFASRHHGALDRTAGILADLMEKKSE